VAWILLQARSEAPQGSTTAAPLGYYRALRCRGVGLRPDPRPAGRL